MQSTTRYRFMIAALAALLLPAVMACSGDSKQTADVEPGTAAAEIDQRNLEFVPSEVEVKVGEVVLIRNSEAAVHNAVINGENVTGNMMKDDTVTWIASAAGEYTVTCDYHPAMRATIVVTP